jgi:hypothetical protein
MFLQVIAKHVTPELARAPHIQNWTMNRKKEEKVTGSKAAGGV